jgi:hypothetical protein
MHAAGTAEMTATVPTETTGSTHLSIRLDVPTLSSGEDTATIRRGSAKFVQISIPWRLLLYVN